MAKTNVEYISPRGERFAVVRADDGELYIHDPQYRLPQRHSIVRVSKPMPLGQGNAAVNAGIQTAESVANMIPGVGPIASSILSVGEDALNAFGISFGGNDPTPLSQLADEVTSLRTQIAQAHQALGIPDTVPTSLPSNYTFTGEPAAIVLEAFPGNTSIDDSNHWNCDATGVNCPGCGNFRICLYATINKLKPIAQQLAQRTGQVQQNQMIAADVQSAVQAAIGAPAGAGAVSQGGLFSSPASAGSATTADVSSTTDMSALGPWLLFGGLAIIGALTLRR